MYRKKSLLLILAVTLCGSYCFADSYSGLSVVSISNQEQIDHSSEIKELTIKVGVKSPMKLKAGSRYFNDGKLRVVEAQDWWTPIFLNNYQEGFDYAKNVASKKLEANPNDEFYNIFLGKAYEFLGQNNEALACYNKVININPNNNSANLACGRLHQLMGEPEKAIKIYDDILRRSPYEFGVRAYKAQCYTDIGMIEKAKNEYKNAIQIDSNDLISISGLYNLLEKTTPPSEIIVEIMPKYKIKPITSDAYVELAKKLNDGGGREEAMTNYKYAIDLAPKNIQTYMELADLYDHMGKDEEARCILMSAKPFCKDNMDTIDNINKVLIERSKDPIADADNNINNDVPGDRISYYNCIENKTLPVYLTLANSFLAINDTDKAIEEFNKALELDPENPDIYYKIALVQEKRGELGDAKNSIKKSLLYYPNDENFLAVLNNIQASANDKLIKNALSSIDEGNYVKAADAINELFKEDQKEARIYYCRGLLRYKMGNIDSALEDLIIGNQMDKTNTAISSLMAAIYEPTDPQLALKYYQECLANSTDLTGDVAVNAKSKIDQLNNIVPVNNVAPVKTVAPAVKTVKTEQKAN